MRKLLSWTGLLIFGPLFGILFFMLLFMMPLEFVVSSWHLYRTRDGLTHGKVVSSEKVTHRGNSRSDIRYRYVVGDREYESDRVHAGWISNHGFEAGAGELGGALRPRDTIPIYYDPNHPEFALLEYGWPKWSIGFSMVVWGLIVGSACSPDSRLGIIGASRSMRMTLTRRLLGYGVGKGMLLVGFGTIILRPPTVEPQDLPLLFTAWALASAAAVGYGWFRHYRKVPQRLA
ncbi:DUF3592 domain-containing protein [Verrucomicrobium sp. BvORR034]|uniref:DUF3592 domain-containing protein n=1 Tax=Verrucomicrobium sp. BvORR034 TaxID=1396418 RepID=UPI0006784C22|nr:DUF3592 domain-containing protein [Verrucomicrobium sp. BvORR034]